jgi:hypothetical protein
MGYLKTGLCLWIILWILWITCGGKIFILLLYAPIVEFRTVSYLT